MKDDKDLKFGENAEEDFIGFYDGFFYRATNSRTSNFMEMD